MVSKVTLVIMFIYFVVAFGIGFFVPIPVRNDEMSSLEVHQIWITQMVLAASCIFGFLGLLVVSIFELRNPLK